MELHSPNQSKEDDKKLGLSIGDEGPERFTVNDTEFYCLDGGFASHLPSHYKVLWDQNGTICRPPFPQSW